MAMPSVPASHRHSPQQQRQPQRSLRLCRWGNALAVRFPNGLMRALQLREGDQLSLELSPNHELLLRPQHGESLLNLMADLRAWHPHLPPQPATLPSLRTLPPPGPEHPPGPVPSHQSGVVPGPANARRHGGPTYVDTGVVLALLGPEPMGERALRWFSSQASNAIRADLAGSISSELLVAETHAALRLKALDPGQRQRCRQFLQRLTAGPIQLQPLDATVIAQATALLADPDLPTLHPSAAQHLATALVHGCGPVLSLDRALVAAARRLGLVAIRFGETRWDAEPPP